MKTPFSIYLCGVLECVGGVLVLLMSVGMVFASLVAPMPGGAGVTRGLMLGIAGFYGLMGALGVATGICVCMRKNWARWSTLIFSWISIVMCAMTGLVIFMMPQPPGSPASPEMMKAVKLSMLCVFGCIGLLCGWWAWLFSRPRIKELFTAGIEVRGSARPLSISILGWLWIFTGGAMGIAMAVAGFPLAMGTWILTGWSARVVMLLWGVAYVALGWGLLKLKEWARLGSLALMGFGLGNCVVAYGFPGRMERLQLLLNSYPWKIPHTDVATMMPSFWGGVAGGLLAVVVPAYFLITRKAAFVAPVGNGGDSSAPPASSPSPLAPPPVAGD